MFIHWLNDELIFNHITEAGINHKIKFDENCYNLIMNDERIKELLRTNSFYVESHPFGINQTIVDAMQIRVSGAIGKIKNILLDGVDFEKFNDEDTNKLFKDLDPKSLRAQRCCIYNKNTGDIKLVKINIGYKRGPKFIVI